MVRFDKVLSMDGETESCGQLQGTTGGGCPARLIEDVNMKVHAPGRRFQAIARKERGVARNSTLHEQWLAEKGSATKFLDFDAMEFAKMQHLKNIAAFRDTVVLAMEAVLNHIRPDYAAEDGSLAGMSLKSKDSDGGASSKSKKSESTKKGRLPVPSTSSSSSIAANKKGLLKRIGMSKDSQDDEQTREDDTSQFTAGDDTASLAASQATMSVALRGGPSVMLGLSALVPLHVI